MSDDNSTLSDVDDSESASSAGVANEPCRFTRANDAAERLMGDKQREWDTVAKKQGNLHLLDLPHDILSCIVAQIHDMNDMTSLARTCLPFHELATPHIYSRFDIFWPKPGAKSESSDGVDALTHGLNTLVMSRQVFDEPGNPVASSASAQGRRKRLGNDYARHTKSFSIGNGPDHETEKYSIFESGGKMLGTLVALAVARMDNLSSFNWDMSTGLTREVFYSLSSLSDRSKDGQCRLKRVHIRCHHNRPLEVSSARGPPADGAQAAATPRTRRTRELLDESSIDHVDHPTLSILPPLESLSVQDIDELAYLDEMSILIARSRDCLRELRVSISSDMTKRDWYATWELDEQTRLVSQMERGAVESDARIGGVLGTLFGQFLCQRLRDLRSAEPGEPTDSDKAKSASFSAGRVSVDVGTIQKEAHLALTTPASEVSSKVTSWPKLHLQMLELQRVPLCVSVLGRTLDWGSLQDLTLLRCEGTDKFWKEMRLQHGVSQGRLSGVTMRKIHVDAVSTHLISFLRESLPPNSLEVLFIQNSTTMPAVTIDQIVRGPLRRHRASLKKICIDSSYKVAGGSVSFENSWKIWVVPRRHLSFLMAGKMTNLKELCISIHHRDWHFLLQGLPKMPQLRALYIPLLIPSSLRGIDGRDLALQVIDIITMRPEIELSYLGILNKCYEIVENRNDESEEGGGTGRETVGDVQASSSNPIPGGGQDGANGDDTGDETEHEDEGGDEIFSDEEDEAMMDSVDELSSLDGSEAGSGDANEVSFKLRDIMFFDDISIFRIRDGKP